MNSVELIKKICKERKIPISRLERELGTEMATSISYAKELSLLIVP